MKLLKFLIQYLSIEAIEVIVDVFASELQRRKADHYDRTTREIYNRDSP